MLVKNIDFKVHGVTFDNEDGINIQDGIVKILNEYKKNDYFDELYCGYSKKEIIEMDLNVSEYEGYTFSGSIKEDIFENKKCYKVYLDTYHDFKFHIGYVPIELVNEISEWLSKEDLKLITNITITGGKCKHCVSTTENYEDIETVEITELAYGFKVELRFCDNASSTTVTTKEKKRGLFNRFLKK